MKANLPDRDKETLKLPVVFIGSATEGLNIAKQLGRGLEDVADCKLWKHGVFGLSQGTLESLIETTKRSDFAILLVTADDLATKKGKRTHIPRDNIVFEIGLFMGALGRERTFIVHRQDKSIDLPSDLAGITTATFSSEGKSLAQALTDVSVRLKSEIKKRGRRDEQEQSAGAMVDLLGSWKCTWFVRRLHSIKDEIVVTKVLGEKIFATGLNAKFGNYELTGRIAPGGVLTFYYEGDAKRHFSGGILILKLGINSRNEMNGFWYEFDADREIYGGKVAWKKA